MKLVTTLLLFAGAAMAAAPCTTVATCTDLVTLGGGPWRSKVYTTYPLGTVNPQITRAFVMVHGTGRDADNYYRTAIAAAFLGGALEDTIVIAPRFSSNASGSCRDWTFFPAAYYIGSLRQGPPSAMDVCRPTSHFPVSPSATRQMVKNQIEMPRC